MLRGEAPSITTMLRCYFQVISRPTLPRFWTRRKILLAPVVAALTIFLTAEAAASQPETRTDTVAVTPGGAPVRSEDRRLIQLGAGDSVSVQVYGQPDMSSTEYIDDGGTISLPLVGTVHVAGLSPVEAAQRIEKALRDGQFLIEPHVTLTVTQSHSQRVSVLGEIHAPARYPIEPNTSIFDLLALAGGVTENSADVIYVMRTDADGKVSRFPVDLKALADQRNSLPPQTLRSGDSIFVPRAEQFYIYGEVNNPKKYRIEPDMTVIQAIALAGGLTPRGSERRVDIKRKGPDGNYANIHARSSDPVRSDDVIHVKESIF